MISFRAASLALAVLIAALLAVFWPRGQVPPDELVRREVISMVRAAEERSVVAVMAPISDRFVSAGGLDKRELQQLVAGELLRATWMRIFTTELAVSATSGTTADFTGKFIFGRSGAKALKDLAKESVLSTYLIEARAEKEQDGHWRFVWARYELLDGRSPVVNYCPVVNY